MSRPTVCPSPFHTTCPSVFPTVWLSYFMYHCQRRIYTRKRHKSPKICLKVGYFYNKSQKNAYIFPTICTTTCPAACCTEFSTAFFMPFSLFYCLSYPRPCCLPKCLSYHRPCCLPKCLSYHLHVLLHGILLALLEVLLPVLLYLCPITTFYETGLRYDCVIYNSDNGDITA